MDVFLCILTLYTLQVCVLEDVAGLQASVLAVRGDCLDSPDITVGVSLERGTPALLLFSLTGDSSSFSETREMNTRKEIFHIEHPIQGMEETITYGPHLCPVKTLRRTIFPPGTDPC